MENKAKRMEDEEKGIQLELEVEEQERIVSLGVEIRRERVNGGIKKMVPKEINVGIYCNNRSDYEVTKRNLITNMGRNIEKLKTKDEEKERLKQ